MDVNKLDEARDKAYSDAYSVIFRKLTDAPLSDKDQQVLKQVLIFLTGILVAPSVANASRDFLYEALTVADSETDVAECDLMAAVLKAASDAGFDACKQDYKSTGR